MRQRVVFRRVIRGTFGVITVSEQIQNKRTKQGVNSPENVVRRAPLIAHFLQFMGWFVPQFYQRPQYLLLIKPPRKSIRNVSGSTARMGFNEFLNFIQKTHDHP